MDNHALLRRRGGTPPAEKAKVQATERGRDPVAHAFEVGPWPVLEVPAWPADLVALVERVTGRPFEAPLHAAYERVRAFLAYGGPTLTPALLAAQRRGGETPRGAVPPVHPPAAPKASRDTPTAPKASMRHEADGIDPTDLGDE